MVADQEQELYSSRPASPQYFMDSLFWRLNGAEALIVAQKFTAVEGKYWGKTYVNIPKLAVPRVLRLWSSEPFYIAWETVYVGDPPSDPTVIPMPALIEAFLNFGVVGVVVVMFILGWIYRRVDLLMPVLRNSDLGVGVYAYFVWQFLNIEHNISDTLVPPLKTIFLVVVLAWIYRGGVTKRKVPGNVEPDGHSVDSPNKQSA
jgi:hypothetical protein